MTTANGAVYVIITVNREGLPACRTGVSKRNRFACSVRHSVKLGLGGTIGSGRQYISWIHEQDFLRIVSYVLHCDHIEGVLHATSPEPVTDWHFMSALRDALGVKIGVPSWSLFVKAGAYIMGTEPSLMLGGRGAVPGVLQAANFIFEFSQIEPALQHLGGNAEKL